MKQIMTYMLDVMFAAKRVETLVYVFDDRRVLYCHDSVIWH